MRTVGEPTSRTSRWAQVSSLARLHADDLELIVHVHGDRRPVGLRHVRLVLGVAVGVGLDADDRPVRDLAGAFGTPVTLLSIGFTSLRSWTCPPCRAEVRGD